MTKHSAGLILTDGEIPSMRRIRAGLYFRFISATVALALIPSVFIGALLLQINRKGLQASVLELHTKLAEKLAEGVDGYLRALDDKLRFTLGVLSRSNMGWTEKQELLRGLIDANADIEEISVLNRRGLELLKVYSPSLPGRPELSSRAAEPAFQRFNKSKSRTLWITPREDQAPQLEIYYPLNEVVSLRVSLSARRLWESIGAESVGGTGFAMVIDGEGRPLFYPPQRLEAGLRPQLNRLLIVQQALRAVTVGSSEFRDLRGLWRVGAYAPLQEMQGAVIIEQPKDEAYHAAAQMIRTATIWFVIFGVLAFALAVWMAGRLTRPLLALTRAATQVADGSFPEPVGIQTGDELQDLADTFNLMVGRLRMYAEMQVDRLVEEQRKTEAILFSIGDGILMTDKEGSIQLANRRAKELLGVSMEENINGRALVECVAEGPLREALERARQDPKPNAFHEVNLSSDQYRRIIRVSAQPVMVPKKGIELGVVTAVRDVTYEKELDKMKEEFLHSITHDLRNPIGSVVGFSEFLLKGVVGVLNPQQSSMVESIRKAATRLLGMVNNILDLAKMEAGHLEVKLQEVSMAGVAGHALNLLTPLAQRRGLKMELEAAEEFTIMADGDLMERVLINLVGNAIKFAAEDGKVKVSVQDKGDAVEFCVADDGEGIPPQFLGKIFEKFEQVPGQRRGGTGLGLTICRLILEAHLGRIWVESEPGHGARFYASVPKDLAPGEGGKVVRKAAAVGPA